MGSGDVLAPVYGCDPAPDPFGVPVLKKILSYGYLQSRSSASPLIVDAARFSIPAGIRKLAFEIRDRAHYPFFRASERFEVAVFLKDAEPRHPPWWPY